MISGQNESLPITASTAFVFPKRLTGSNAAAYILMSTTTPG